MAGRLKFIVKDGGWQELEAANDLHPGEINLQFGYKGQSPLGWGPMFLPMFLHQI